MSVFNVFKRKPSLGTPACVPSNACQSRLSAMFLICREPIVLLVRKDPINCEVESTALDKNCLLCNSQYGVMK